MKDNINAEDRILIVEDDEDTRLVLTRLLEKNGYLSVSCENGYEAIELIQEFHPKVIMADWTMPEMDGPELCSIIKNNEKSKYIYFILLTAKASLNDRIIGLDLGADDFLIKPIENQELLARIRTGIRIFNLQNELKKSEQNKALIAMACTIGHQINNPLSSLVLVIEFLKEVLDLSDKDTLESFEIAELSIHRIRKFVNDLINLQNPEIIDYALNSKMIRFDNEGRF